MSVALAGIVAEGKGVVAVGEGAAAVGEGAAEVARKARRLSPTRGLEKTKLECHRKGASVRLTPPQQMVRGGRRRRGASKGGAVLWPQMMRLRGRGSVHAAEHGRRRGDRAVGLSSPEWTWR